MLSLLESFLVAMFNGSRRRLARRRAETRKRPSSTATGSSEKVVLGTLIPDRPERDEQPVAISLSLEERLRHLYMLGGTGCGKTNLVMNLLESDIAHRRSFGVIDLRGDLVDRILLRLAAMGSPQETAERLLLIDLRHADYVVSFNPLAGPGEPYGRALHVLSVLRRQAESWGVQLDESLRNCLIALASAGWSLMEVEPLLTNPEFRRSVLDRCEDPYVRAFFRRYDQLSAEKQNAWLLPVLNKISPLLSVGPLRLLFCPQQGIRLGNWLDRPGTIVLVALAADRLSESAHLAGGLLVSSLQTAVMARSARPESERHPWFLYCDEFENLAYDRFEAIIAEGRRFGLGLCLCHQDLSQIPARLRNTVRNNAGTQLFFRTGAVDAAELSAELVGIRSRERASALLATQATGEAYLVRRGQATRRIRIPHCPDPEVSPQAVEALRDAAMRAHGRPGDEVENELAGRDRTYGSPEAPENTPYEVRDSAPTYHPKSA